MKIVTIKGLWFLYWRTEFQIYISSRLSVIGVSTLKIGHIHTHARTHTHTSGRQLKITFLDVLDYSEYSDTNISKNKISRKHSFLSEEAKRMVNQDSHIASSPIPQSFFFVEVRCLIFVSSQKKLHEYIEFWKFDVTIK